MTFLGVAGALAERVPRGHSALSDQLRRAALSVPLNIAEGSGKGTMEDREARRFYAIARAVRLWNAPPSLMPSKLCNSFWPPRQTVRMSYSNASFRCSQKWLA